MKTLTIKKNSVVTHGPSSFQSLEELEQHLAKHEEMQSYGIPAHTIQILISEETPAVIESQEQLDENGASFDPPVFADVEILAAVPAVYETQEIPADYEVIIEDISSQIEAEQVRQAKIEAGKKAREGVWCC